MKRNKNKALGGVGLGSLRSSLPDLEKLLQEAQEKLADCTVEEAEAIRTSLEKPWAEAQAKEAELIEAMKDLYREAGAHELQFTWGTFPYVPLGPKAQKQAVRLFKERSKLNRQVIPLMCMAAAANERIERG